MGETKWTQAQRKVIDVRNRNVLVSAAAGSGKTAVLVERIISMISEGEHPADIDRLLVVTFTNAAASQMRERIEKAVNEKVKQQPGNAHLLKQKTLIYGAKITTIHSFCLSVIRSYFNLIDLDPGFRMADDAELLLLKTDVAEELLEQKYEEADEGFLQFIEFYATGKTDDRLVEQILKLHDYSVSYPWPREWLLEREGDFNIPGMKELEQADFMRELLSYIRFILEGIPERIRQAAVICSEAGGPASYLHGLRSDESMVRGLLENRFYEEYFEAFSRLEWVRLKAVSKKDGVDEQKKERVQEIRKEVKDTLEDIRKSFFFQTPEQMLADMQNTAPAVSRLIELALDFSEEYQRKKEEKRILDYSDLEHRALEILVHKNEDGSIHPTLAANELSEFYEEILIDEYQDSNLVQEMLLNSISRERRGQPNVFMVGDVKQSIYKFRLARPELFMEKYDTYRKWEDGDSLYQRIDLHRNFRSREEIIDSVNFIFRQIMRRELGNIAYDDEAALYPGAQFPETEADTARGLECILVSPEEEAEKLKQKELRQLEAEAAADRIIALTDSGKGAFIYENGYRRARYGDIVILLRSMAGQADEFARVLSDRGIPAYTDTGSGYFSALEVRTVLNLLKIIDNPRQDIPLTAILNSPIGGFNPEELAALRSVSPDSDMYDALSGYGKRGLLPELRRKAEIFLTELESYRRLVPVTDIHRLLEYVLEDTGYYRYVTVMPSGDKRKANLDMLVNKAIEFEATSYRGLFHFNRYIERLHKYEIDFGEAAQEEEGIRIMSIHKSKGLEFPIVIVAGLGKAFNTQDSRSKIVFHPSLGLGPDYVDARLRIKAPTLLKKVIQKQQVLENLGEELRVLYVAFTRAKEKLILIGTLKDPDKAAERWRERGSRKEIAMPFYRLSKAGSFLDFVGPALFYPNNLPLELTFLKTGELTGREILRQTADLCRKQELLCWNPDKIYDRQWHDGLEQAMGYQYPYRNEENYPGKVTVTELKKMALTQEEEEEAGVLMPDTEMTEAPKPRFISRKEPVSGAGRGNIYHKVMECLDFTHVSGDGIEEQLGALIRKGILKENDCALLDLRRISAFFQTELAARMARSQRSGKLYREQRFVAGLPVSRLSSPEAISADGDRFLVQGIIDAYFEEGDGLILVDYKTDRVVKGGGDGLAKQYRVQFDYYTEALTRLAHKPVKERYLYSFSLGLAVRI